MKYVRIKRRKVLGFLVFNKEINFLFIIQYQDNNNFCYSEVEKATDYQLIGKSLVLRKDTSSVIKKY